MAVHKVPSADVHQRHARNFPGREKVLQDAQPLGLRVGLGQAEQLQVTLLEHERQCLGKRVVGDSG